MSNCALCCFFALCRLKKQGQKEMGYKEVSTDHSTRMNISHWGLSCVHFSVSLYTDLLQKAKEKPSGNLPSMLRWIFTTWQVGTLSVFPHFPYQVSPPELSSSSSISTASSSFLGSLRCLLQWLNQSPTCPLCKSNLGLHAGENTRLVMASGQIDIGSSVWLQHQDQELFIFFHIYIDVSLSSIFVWKVLTRVHLPFYFTASHCYYFIFCRLYSHLWSFALWCSWVNLQLSAIYMLVLSFYVMDELEKGMIFPHFLILMKDCTWVMDIQKQLYRVLLTIPEWTSAYITYFGLRCLLCHRVQSILGYLFPYDAMMLESPENVQICSKIYLLRSPSCFVMDCCIDVCAIFREFYDSPLLLSCCICMPF